MRSSSIVNLRSVKKDQLATCQLLLLQPLWERGCRSSIKPDSIRTVRANAVSLSTPCLHQQIALHLVWLHAKRATSVFSVLPQSLLLTRSLQREHRSCCEAQCALWNTLHVLFPPTFSNCYLLQRHLNNEAIPCHVIHFNKTKLQCWSQTMELHSPLNPAKSNNEIINVIDHPYLAKSHLQTETETNTYCNKLPHPAKRTTAAQWSLTPITSSYRFFPFPTQDNNAGSAMSVPILTHCCHHSNKFTLSLKRESTNTSTHHGGQNLSEETAGALLLETFKFKLALWGIK